MKIDRKEIIMDLSFFDLPFKKYMVQFIKEVMKSNDEDVYDAISDVIDDLEVLEEKFEKEGFIVKSGASKLVFINFNRVLKVYFDEECLCETEPIVYKKAKEKSLDEYFAKTGDLHADFFSIERTVVPFWYYEQERVVTNDPTNRYKRDNLKAWTSSPKSLRNITFPDCVDSYKSFRDCCTLSGRSDIQKLFFFLQKMGISDFHNGNFFMRRGIPVLIDFSGYRGG